MSPAAFKGSPAGFVVHRGDPADDLPAALRPAVRRVIVWERDDPPDEVFNTDADLAAALPGWGRTAEQVYVVRDVWTGQDLTRYRRREYVRP